MGWILTVVMAWLMIVTFAVVLLKALSLLDEV